MKYLLSLIAMSCLAMPAGVVHSNEPQVPSPEDLKRADWIEAGENRFIKSCAFCHGTKGESGKTAAFSTRQNWDAEVIFNVISEGRTNGSNVMPSWKGSIPDEQIWKIVAYIKSLSASESK